MNALGIIFSNIHDSNLSELTQSRTMGSVPFGGRYRLIDFPLSSMVNSGISKVGIVTKSNYQSLMDHLGSGMDWDLARKNGGLIILPPFGAEDSSKLYSTRLEALKGITKFLLRSNEEYVIMSDCDFICNIYYPPILNFHKSMNADVTMVYQHKKTESGQSNNTFIKFNNENRVTDIASIDNYEGEGNMFLNIYIIKRLFLLSLINNAVAHGYTNFNLDCLLRNINKYNIFAYDYRGYFSRITSLPSYYVNSLKLLTPAVKNELFDYRVVFTKVRDSAPTKYGSLAIVNNSFVADGCDIKGEVENSILFRGVKVGRGSVIKNSILMQDTYVCENVNLNAVITDKNVVIRDKRNLSGCEVQPYFIAKGQMI